MGLGRSKFRCSVRNTNRNEGIGIDLRPGRLPDGSPSTMRSQACSAPHSTSLTRPGLRDLE